MNYSIKHILRSIVVISLCAVASSCSQDPLDIEKNGDFISGEIPLKLTTDVEGMITRAGTTDYWIDEDSIRVRIGTYPWIGKYKLNPDGSVKEAVEALAWPHPKDSVSAWFPCLEENTVVSIADQSKGYHAFDFMSASTNGIVDYKDIVHLNFKHKMAKVSCQLIKGDGVTEEDLKTAKISYFGYNSVTFNEKGLTGSDEDWIIPYSNYDALLYPQDMSGKNFIKVELTLKVNDAEIPKTLIYNPESGKGTLEAGKHYTYTIKVQKDRLEVQTITGAWTESLENTVPTSDKYHIYLTENTGELGELEFSSNVTEISADTRAWSGRCLEVLGDYFTISYKVTTDNCHLGIFFADKETLNEVKRTYYEKQNSVNDGYYEFSYKIVSKISDSVYLKKGEYIEIGDILFQDGKWGGIPEKIYEGKKKPVGIVFKVGAGGENKTLDIPTNYGWNENELEIRGYAVALNDASEDIVQWGPNATLVSIVSYEANDLKNCIARIIYSGIIATKKAKGNGITKYPAFKAACEFKAAGESPTDPIAGSSGWYLPSYRQLTDVRDLFTHPQRREWITKAGGKPFMQHNKRTYCTATERYSSTIWIQDFVYSTNSDPNADTGIQKTKTYSFFVRSVLTLSKLKEEDE